MLSLNDYFYELPEELIARYPADPRPASRLMCLDKQTGAVTHNHFRDLPGLLQPGDLLVLNNTRVIPARVFGRKASGGQVELLIERVIDKHHVLTQIKASKTPKTGMLLHLANTVTAKIIKRQEEFYLIEFLDARPVLDILAEIGHMPLPPYMNRPDEAADWERYQTVFAEQPGAIAAPTAGLHFDQELLNTIKNKGVEIAFVTLHVGAGTFKPIRTEDITQHVMHAEHIEVSAEICEKIRQTKANGKRVVAIGTTTMRCLETAAQNGAIQPYRGDTRIFIYAGYHFNCVDALVTNFHLPQSTLLMLVCAFAGHEPVMAAYRTAVQEGYRFFSYGDAMWVEKK